MMPFIKVACYLENGFTTLIKVPFEAGDFEAISSF